MQKRIGIIGNGFVGNAVAKGFEKHLDVLIYDTDENRSTHSYEETLQSDFVFVCLPTPMVNAESDIYHQVYSSNRNDTKNK